MNRIAFHTGISIISIIHEEKGCGGVEYGAFSTAIWDCSDEKKLQEIILMLMAWEAVFGLFLYLGYIELPGHFHNSRCTFPCDCGG